MFCTQCGREIDDDSKFCTFCGASNIQKQEKKVLLDKPKKRTWKVLLLALGIVVLGFIGGLFMDDSETRTNNDGQVVLDELMTFTDLYKDEDGSKYYFLDKEERWIIGYTEVSSFVMFENDSVVECFTEAFGENCFDIDSLSYGGFIYAIADNTARIYFDVEIEEGHLSIVNYNFNEEEYVLNLDGERYGTTKEFDEFVQQYNLVEEMQDDITLFKESLNEYGLSLNDLLQVKYEIIDEQFVPDEQQDTEEGLVDSNETTDMEETFNFKGDLGTYEGKQVYDNFNGRIEFGNIVDNQIPFTLYVFELDYSVMTASATIVDDSTAQYSDGNLTITFKWSDTREMSVTNSGIYAGADADMIDIITDNIEYVWSEEFN